MYSLPPGGYVALIVKDTGCGMSKQVLDRIFEPYYTTKPVEKGSGMGLAVVHGIVEYHTGGIHVDSEPGKGTCVSILLPEADERAGDD